MQIHPAARLYVASRQCHLISSGKSPARAEKPSPEQLSLSKSVVLAWTAGKEGGRRWTYAKRSRCELSVRGGTRCEPCVPT